MEITDVFRGFFQNAAQLGIQRFHSGVRLGGRHFQTVQISFVKLFCVLEQGVIAILAYIGNDGSHRLRYVNLIFTPGEDFFRSNLSKFIDRNHS